MSIPFLNNVESKAAALKDDSGLMWSYEQLQNKSAQWTDCFAQSEKGLIFLYIENRCDFVAAYLGALASHHVVALLDPSLSLDAKADLHDLYQPDYIVAADSSLHPDGYSQTTMENVVVGHKKNIDSVSLHGDVKLLLSTSGSTGSPKFVRLTRANIEHNAHAIADVLEIKSKDVASGHLQLHYSYGLSVLNSFLVRNAKICLTEKTFMDRDFWPNLNADCITHLPGVPFHYQMMTRLGFKRLKLETVKTLTQAGGKLDQKSLAIAHDYMDSIGGKFFVMYGQTEASPRLTTLSHEGFLQSPESVGPALQDGRFDVLDDDGNPVPVGEKGHIRYFGPNVCMGYAEKRTDLSKPDEFYGQLDTGDIGFLDQNGFLTITGRSKRFAKIYGLRVNLDEIENFVSKYVRNGCLQQGDTVLICVPDGEEYDGEQVLAALEERFTLQKRVYSFISVRELPKSARNKIDYQALEQNIG